MTQFKRKIGEKVTIRKDLEQGINYIMYNDDTVSDVVNSSMMSMVGEEAVIERYSGGKYRLAGVGYNWTDEMLEDNKQPYEVSDLEFTASIAIEVKRVIYADPATIVFYTLGDGDKIKKSVAKCSPADEFDKEKGKAVAILKAFQKEARKEINRH